MTIILKLTETQLPMGTQLFMQDGAMPNTDNVVMCFFGYCVISH